MARRRAALGRAAQFHSLWGLTCGFVLAPAAWLWTSCSFAMGFVSDLFVVLVLARSGGWCLGAFLLGLWGGFGFWFGFGGVGVWVAVGGPRVSFG